MEKDVEDRISAEVALQHKFFESEDKKNRNQEKLLNFQQMFIQTDY